MKYGILLLLLWCMVGKLTADDYYMDNILEPDRIATAWMIREYVDSSAVFHFVKKNSSIKGAISIDRPDSKYRRYPKCSATMRVVAIHKIKDQRALALAKAIDEIELDFWGAQMSPEAKKLKSDLMAIVEQSATLNEALDSTFRYINKNW